MSNQGVAPRRRGSTALRVVLLILAFAFNIAVGLIGAALWIPNLMTLAAGSGTALTLIMLWMSIGPAVALISIIWGMIVHGRKPNSGLAIMFGVPLLWGMSVLAIMANAFYRCNGDWVC